MVMVKDSTVGIICNLIGHKYRVSTRSRDLKPTTGLAISKLYDDGDNINVIVTAFVRM